MNYLDKMPARIEFDFSDVLLINGDPTLEVRPTEFNVTNTGVSVKVLWVHEGSIKQEWVPQHILSRKVVP